MTHEVASQPDNKNFLSPTGFRFSINYLPNVSFFAQRVNIPGIAIGSTVLPTPFHPIPLGGDSGEYEDLIIEFKVDEDLANFIELFNWMKGIASLESFEDHKALVDEDATMGGRLYSDATLLIESSNHKANMSILFHDLFPTTLSSIEFNSQDQAIEYLSSQATFKYRTYSFVDIT